MPDDVCNPAHPLDLLLFQKHHGQRQKRWRKQGTIHDIRRKLRKTKPYVAGSTLICMKEVVRQIFPVIRAASSSVETVCIRPERASRCSTCHKSIWRYSCTPFRRCAGAWRRGAHSSRQHSLYHSRLCRFRFPEAQFTPKQLEIAGEVEKLMFHVEVQQLAEEPLMAFTLDRAVWTLCVRSASPWQGDGA